MSKNQKSTIMKKQQLQAFLLAVFLSTQFLPAQNTSFEKERLGAYVNFASDNQQEYVYQILSLYTDDPSWNIIESPFKDSLYNWGEIIAGTWVEDELYLITNLIRGGIPYVGNYIAYEPFTQTTRFIDKSSGLLPANSADMTYNPITKEIFAVTHNNELLKLSMVDSSSEKIGIITENGLELQNNPFRTLACSNDGILYSFNDNGGIYTIDPLTAKAQRVSTLDIPIGVYDQCATFSPSTGKCYWVNAGSANILYEVDVTTGQTHEIGSTPGLAALFVFHYPHGAPSHPIENLRIVKNPSDYTQATFIFNIPETDMMDVPIQSPVAVEIWKGSSEQDMQLIDIIENVKPGQNQTYIASGEQGTAYYAFRIRNTGGLYSPFTGAYCSFFNVKIPYHTSFEPDEDIQNIITVGDGWTRKTNDEEYTVVHTGTYSYGISEDNTSILRLAGFNVYAGIEYELSLYAAGYNAFWESIMSGPWYEGPDSPLKIKIGDTSYTLELNPIKGEQGYNTMTEYSFRFIPQQSEEINIEFQASSTDDAYFIDDVRVEQLTSSQIPAAIQEISFSTPNHAMKSVDITIEAPSTTQDGNTLESLDGIILQASRYANFINPDGNEDYLADTIENILPGQQSTTTFNLDQEGFWYFRAFAFNHSGMSLPSPIAATDYIGNGFDLQINIKDIRNTPIANARIELSPLFPEVDQSMDTTCNSQGEIVLHGLFAGEYDLHAEAGLLYNDTSIRLSLVQDMAIDIQLSDYLFHKQPQAPQSMQIASIRHDKLQMELSWTNPSLDYDGNALESLEGIVFGYSLREQNFILCDTAHEMQAGETGTHTLNLPGQGETRIIAYAFNAYGNSDTITLDAGYIGNGFQWQFQCVNASDESIPNTHITLIPNYKDTFYTINCNENGMAEIQGLRYGTYSLHAIADYYDRTTWEHLLIEKDVDTTIALKYTLQAPEITGLEIIEPNDVRMDWSVKENRNFYDGFESYPDWEIEEIGDYDLYGAKYKGYFGGLSFPNMQMEYAYLVFNPSAATPSVENNPYWTTHSGKKMLISAFSLKNDDWLVHPVDGGGTLSFFATGAEVDGSGPERFQVLYSTTDNNPGNFITVSEGDYVETTTSWTEYSYKLPDNARYFAIHCVSEDASLFKLDDISYTLDYGSKIAQATGYELYLNGELLRSVAATDSTFTFEDLPDGSHDLGLRALYEDGASDMVTRTVTIGYEVPAPVDLKAHLTDTGWLLTWDMPGGLNAQYYKVFCDGEFVINTQYKQWFLGELQVDEGHYAGVCAVVNEYFSDTVYTKFGEVANEGMDASLTARLYPNPAHQTFYLEVDEACQIGLFSADGRKILSRELTAGKHEFRLEDQTNGVYLISIETAKGTTFKKLILQ